MRFYDESPAEFQAPAGKAVGDSTWTTSFWLWKARCNLVGNNKGISFLQESSPEGFRATLVPLRQ
jgi:hypothetical protein